MWKILTRDRSKFVNVKEIIPDIIIDLRYYKTNNFTGKRVDGYEKEIAYVTKECAEKLKEINEELKKENYTIKIFDAYRPKMATDFFIKWAKDLEDTKTKHIFYKNIEKEELLKKGYISQKSSHTRGSTVDLTIYDLKDKREMDMGSEFDNFGQISHYDYENLTEHQKQNRKYLRTIMTKHGFIPLDIEWWHFTLKDEPYPNTYFNFKVR